MGPQAPEHSVFVSGQHEGRDVGIQSAEPMLGAMAGGVAGYYYWVTVAAKSVLPTMAVAVGRPLPKPDDTTEELRGKCHTAGKLMMDFYAWPQEGERLQPGAMDRIGAALDRGRRFLRARSVVYTEYNTLYYGRTSSFRILDDEQAMGDLVDWLAGLAEVLEQELILEPAEDETEEPPSGMAEALEMDAVLAGLGGGPAAAAEPVGMEPALPLDAGQALPPEAVGAQSLARRAALAVLLTIGFYGLALGIAGVLLFIVYADIFLLGQIQLRLVLVCLAAAGIIIWSVLPRRDQFVAPGPQLLPAEHPALFGEVEAVAQRLGQAPPSEVYLAADVNAGVMERGGILGIGRKRVMLIGLPLLQMLTVEQVRGIVAHEFGHFYGGDTRLGPWIYKTRETIGRTIRNIGKGSWLQAPFRWYGLMFLRTTHAISRRQEFVADRRAAGIVGPRLCPGPADCHRRQPRSKRTCRRNTFPRSKAATFRPSSTDSPGSPTRPASQRRWRATWPTRRRPTRPTPTTPTPRCESGWQHWRHWRGKKALLPVRAPSQMATPPRKATPAPASCCSATWPPRSWRWSKTSCTRNTATNCRP